MTDLASACLPSLDLATNLSGVLATKLSRVQAMEVCSLHFCRMAPAAWSPRLPALKKKL